MKTRKKVAIMTWYTYRNFGTALQATALTHVIENMGYSPTMIQYLPKGGAFEPTIRALKDRIVRKIKTLFFKHYVSNEREKLYTSYFETRISETEPMRSYPELSDLNSQFDAFVCGSDQIWSPNCFDDKYFLSFVDQGEKMVAYAPSLGVSKIQNQLIERKMADCIKRFHHLSVREQQGAGLIHGMTGKTANVVLDPTLLMSASEWDAYACVNQAEQIQSSPYLLCYFLGSSQKYMDYVRRLSKKTNLPIYIIPVSISQKKSKNAVPFEVGPIEFVSLIKNAAYVCTDSFHGIAFAINYNVPFVVFERFANDDVQNQNSRIFNLLKLLHLEDRLVNYKDRCIATALIDCDYKIANRLLQQHREFSLTYLKDSLMCATEHVGQERFLKITDMCCGCGACATVCKKNAISICKDSEGFEHYTIDEEHCVKCGVCKTVCPMTNIIAPDLKNAIALYSIKSRSNSVLENSSSGGVGHELSTSCLKDGYAVCGCIYDAKNKLAKHIWVYTGEEDKLVLLQGSKYLQSISANALKNIVSIAQQQKIAFFGTPCQAAAVDKMLRKNGLRDNALIVDLICHGVPSYHLWNKFLKTIDDKYGTGNNPNVRFREKRDDWHRRVMVVGGEKKNYSQTEVKDDFYAFFRRGLCDMRACSDCPYRERSAADLRIGDYWGKRFSKDKKGVSMVLANTDLGQQVVSRLIKSGTCEGTEHPLLEYWSVQYPYNLNPSLIREVLIRGLCDDGLSLKQLRKKYCSYYDCMELLSRLKQTFHL